MHKSVRPGFLAGCLAFASPLLASDGLSLLRTGVGVTGVPVQLSGPLDSNGNGRRELLVEERGRISLVEDDANLRGYREIARLHAPELAYFKSALVVDVPGAAPALLLQWGQLLELRDMATLRVKASINASFGYPALGDVDGDGVPEIVVSSGGTIKLFDPVSLAPRGTVPRTVGQIALADIVGDARAEIISSDGRAYTVTREGTALSASEVWNSGIAGSWIPYAIDIDGHAAIVLHDSFGFSAKLATFRPAASLRELVPSEGPSFRPLFADVNHDGKTDLIAADSSHLRALDIASGATLWQRDTIYQAPYLGSVHSPVSVDLDGDGAVELAWADAYYDSGIVTMQVPPTGTPRWQADREQSQVADLTSVRHADNSSSLAYLTNATYTGPRLGTLGFLDATTLADQGGSALAWLPGYTGLGPYKRQNAITTLRQPGQADTIVVAGAEWTLSDNAPVARWLWSFDDSGALLSARPFTADIDPQRIVAAQALARPERQLIIAGWLPPGTSSTSTQAARVIIIDYATGDLLWQSAPLLPSSYGAPLTKLDVADLDADGRLDVVLAHGEKVIVLTPAASTSAIREYTAETFSLLGPGRARNAKLATLHQADIAVYDGFASVPEKTFVLPEATSAGIALFAQPPDDTLMFVTLNPAGLTVRHYADGETVAVSRPSNFSGFTSLTAMDSDGDQRIEIVGSNPGLMAWRLENDYIFRDGMEVRAGL